MRISLRQKQNWSWHSFAIASNMLWVSQTKKGISPNGCVRHLISLMHFPIHFLSFSFTFFNLCKLQHHELCLFISVAFFLFFESSTRNPFSLSFSALSAHLSRVPVFFSNFPYFVRFFLVVPFCFVRFFCYSLFT